ncbi:hypothetical protein B0H13DRAFT_2376234 [Mycena leptocephala]|nr:hypothetical protein B0H13DRAFT_2376234 [Mycena leptocephala]
MSSTPAELRLERLSRLPPEFRRETLPVDLAKHFAVSMISFWMAEIFPTGSCSFLFSTPYILRARIPTAEEADEKPQSTGSALDRVLTVIDALRAMRKITPRIFLFTFGRCSGLGWSVLSSVAAASRVQCRAKKRFIADGGALHPLDPTLSKMISATSGVCTLICRSWVALMALDDIIDLYSVAFFLITAPIISRTREETTSEIQEWIDAAGGTHWHLATIVVRYLDVIAAHPLHSELHVHAALAFICQFLGDENRDLLDTLLECGLATALTGTIAALLTENMDYPIDNHLDRSLALLMLILTRACSKGHRWMVDSLKGGLLPALVSITQRERAPHYANRILEVALPSSLIRYRAVVQAGISISPALTIMKNLVDIQKVPESLKFFLRILSDRLIVKEDYESVHASVGCSCVDLKSENAAVVQGDTTVPSNVKKLTGAKRDIGASLSILTAKSDDASTLDRIFMRLVVHHGYESSKESSSAAKFYSCARTQIPISIACTTSRMAYQASECTPSETFRA